MDELKGLKDIKDIVEVNTFNPLWILLALFLLLALILLAIYLKRKYRKKRRFKLTPKELAKKEIDSINWQDPKSVAYTFSEDVAMFVNEDNKKEYEDILKELREYKYKKEVPSMSSELKSRIKKFIKGIKWQI